MLYDDESTKEFDVRLLVREEYVVLKRRREERSGYVGAIFVLAQSKLTK